MYLSKLNILSTNLHMRMNSAQYFHSFRPEECVGGRVKACMRFSQDHLSRFELKGTKVDNLDKISHVSGPAELYNGLVRPKQTDLVNWKAHSSEKNKSPMINP